MDIENLKMTLFNLYCSTGISPFFDSLSFDNGKITAKNRNVCIEGNEEEIIVFFDENLYLYPKKLQYLTKDNTYKTFQTINFALEYFQYIVRATNDMRFELYHYFLYELQKVGITNDSWNFHYTNNENMENMIINLGIFNLRKFNKKLFFNIEILFFKENVCKLSFIPEKPLWNEGKICPQRDVDKIIEYILNLKVDNYEDIPLIES
ncbi:hypothetical protein ABEG63_21475 [Chryseobacterium sp. C39-AII1]|uniref:hypothetical protein n=1 Tax=Chryseobacterium sp. C39-AII1 TaxID=3080332 RepID=UPI00320A180B